MTRHHKSSDKGHLEFKTVALPEDVLTSPRSHNHVVLKSVDDGLLYKLRLHRPSAVDDRTRPSLTREPPAPNLPETQALTVRLHSDFVEFWRGEEFLFAVRFAKFDLEPLDGKIAASGQ